MNVKINSKNNISYVKNINKSNSHELVPQMHPKVQLIRSGDDGVDQGHAVCSELFIMIDQQTLSTPMSK